MLITVESMLKTLPQVYKGSLNKTGSVIHFEFYIDQGAGSECTRTVVKIDRYCRDRYTIRTRRIYGYDVERSQYTQETGEQEREVEGNKGLIKLERAMVEYKTNQNGESLPFNPRSFYWYNDNQGSN